MLVDALRGVLSRRPRRANQFAAAADRLYRGIVAQARTPVFYESYGVPDTVDGRFELIVLHAYLTLRRLNSASAEHDGLGQAVLEVMVRDMDLSLRELGVGDLSVGRKVKTMARAFYGRAAAYDTGFDEGTASLVAALRRNMYGTVDPSDDMVDRMADYLWLADAHLSGLPDDALLAGDVTFPSGQSTES